MQHVKHKLNLPFTALPDHGNHPPYILHGVYYLKDSGVQVSSVYHTCMGGPVQQHTALSDEAYLPHTYCMILILQRQGYQVRGVLLGVRQRTDPYITERCRKMLLVKIYKRSRFQPNIK